MTQPDFSRRRSLSKPELQAYARRVPAAPIAMFDRITHIEHNDNRGRIIAEQDRLNDLWYPGSTGVEGIWQLLAFYLILRGAPAGGLALGCKEISCIGQLRAHHVCLRYDVSVTLVSQFRQSGASIAMGDGVILADGESICSIRDAQVAAFAAIQQDPSASSSHRGSNPRAQGETVLHSRV
jgi:3-hydroxymyristoyl/3-hydroxydecanoyl-(acyl carrier protein) dehydratase